MTMSSGVTLAMVKYATMVLGGINSIRECY